jgi:hypothetical protein
LKYRQVYVWHLACIFCRDARRSVRIQLNVFDTIAQAKASATPIDGKWQVASARVRLEPERARLHECDLASYDRETHLDTFR